MLSKVHRLLTEGDMAWQQTGPVPDRKPLNAGQTRAQQDTARQLREDGDAVQKRMSDMAKCQRRNSRSPGIEHIRAHEALYTNVVGL